ncbi:MAG: hypothetical protein ACYSWQ_12820 [Planctomycetota bacterium]
MQPKRLLGDMFYADAGAISTGRKGWHVTFKNGKPGPVAPEPTTPTRKTSSKPSAAGGQAT